VISQAAADSDLLLVQGEDPRIHNEISIFGQENVFFLGLTGQGELPRR
jgi:hypothetical protein